MDEMKERGAGIAASEAGRAGNIGHRPTKLSAYLEAIVLGGDDISDLLIEEDQPVMLRRGSYDWVAAQHGGNPIIPTHKQVVGFLHGIYGGDEENPPSDDIPRTHQQQTEQPWWRKELVLRGSLQPARQLASADGTKSVRMRCLIQRQGMGESVGIVMRRIGEVPESIQGLGLPYQIETLLQRTSRGLVIVTGPTGSGKSTTMAAMIDQINRTRTANILTFEDPVEFIHERKKSMVHQREVGTDMASYADGVIDALRFVPDVIMIGEIRDATTMQQALRLAESGHLVITSLHAPDWSSAVRKAIALLSNSAGDVQSLPHVLVAVIAQALIRPKDGKGKRHLAAEFVNCTEREVVDAISATVSPQGESNNKGLSALVRTMAEPRATRKGAGAWHVTMLDAVQKLIETDKIIPTDAMFAVASAESKAKLAEMIAAGQ